MSVIGVFLLALLAVAAQKENEEKEAFSWS